MPTTTRCPCGSGEPYAECCGRLHAGESSAPTAAGLMASRFSAFAVGDAGYLLATWHPSSRPAELVLDDDVHWLRLDVVETVGGGLLDTSGIVEFRAHHRSSAGRGVLHERSTFVREDGRWFYLSGTSPG